MDEANFKELLACISSPEFIPRKNQMSQGFSALFTPFLIFVTLSASAANLSCDSSAECNKLGAAAYKKSRFEEAASYFWQQVRYAELTNAKTALAAYNNVALAEFKAGKCLTPLAWLRVSEDYAKREGRVDEATRHNIQPRIQV